MESSVYEKLVNHPAHYVEQSAMIEPIELCERLGFNLGNAVKYIVRAGHKGDAVEDLEKAKWYLLRARSFAFLPTDATKDEVTDFLLQKFAQSTGFEELARLLDTRAHFVEQRISALITAVEARIAALEDPDHAP